MGPRRPHSRAPSPYETAQRFTDPKAAQARTAGTETTTKPRAMSPTQKANEVVCEKLYQQGGRPAAAVAVAVPAALSRTRKTARKASSTRARKPPRGVPAVRVDAAAPLVQPYVERAVLRCCCCYYYYHWAALLLRPPQLHS